MSKENGPRPSDNQNVVERRMYVAENLISFSKHLMLLLAAVIAFAAAPILSDAPKYLQICFALGVALGITSFMVGHEGISVILSAYIQKDRQDDFLRLEDSLTKGALQKCKVRVEIQYWLMLGSLLIIAACIVASAFVNVKAPIQCVPIKDTSSETSVNPPVASSKLDATAGSGGNIKPAPEPGVSQPK